MVFLIIFYRFVKMELKYWIYIIVGAIYVLSKLLKKPGGSATDIPDAEQPASRPTTERSIPTSQPQKTLTFEELLREITEAKTIQEKPKSSPKPVFADYDEDEEEEAKSLETIPSYNYNKKPVVYDEYEEGKKIAFNRPSLEETTKLADTDVRFGKFKVFEEEKQEDFLSNYMKDLRDPEGFRKAFVMSEILNRKY
jgi:hypothetical protein